MNKRDFLKLSGGLGITAAMGGRAAAAADSDQLQNMTSNAIPISVSERKTRVAKAQRLMQESGVVALLLEAGSALVYFTGVRWRRSERFTGATIPTEGDLAFVTPYFEEPSVRESMTFGDDVRTWHEPINFVRGESTPLASGIYVFGEFGVRLEDCLHMTEDGPRLFSELSASIDKLFG